MQITTELLRPYVGGQLEVQNQVEGYLFRGEIRDIAIVKGEISAHLVWNARGEGFPPLPKRWVNHKQLAYFATADLFVASNIGPSGPDVGGGDRLSLHSHIIGETIVLYPADGSKLDPAKVEGLQLAQA